MTAPPDVLVLGVGGILGEAWMSGYLAGMREATGMDAREARAFVGTSAGSIVAAHLAAGVEPERAATAPAGDDEPAPAPSGLRAAVERAGGLWMNAVAPLARPALDAVTPAGALARAALLASVPRGSIPLDDLRARVRGTGARFDGRLRVVAVDRGRGRRTVFGAPGAPDASVADAVAASCAIPGVLTPIHIEGREYVDGGAWSPTNLDIAPVQRESAVLCLVPTAALARAGRLALRALSAGWQATTRLEVAALRSRGATVTVVAPDARSAAAIGANAMDARRRRQVLAEGFRQGAAGAPRRAAARR